MGFCLIIEGHNKDKNWNVGGSCFPKVEHVHSCLYTVSSIQAAVNVKWQVGGCVQLGEAGNVHN